MFVFPPAKSSMYIWIFPKKLKERETSHIAGTYEEPAWHMKGILLLHKLGIMKSSTQVHMHQHCLA